MYFNSALLSRALEVDGKFVHTSYQTDGTGVYGDNEEEEGDAY